ncbi:hypothetical protein BGZ59_000733 [Podila verticillata]|nr:hypothetical protein BGZ59_000733 [Podila verticillata]KFH72022.1 hypothetical protein MVEG_02315 [Podila verticillata NRRL 6337]
MLLSPVSHYSYDQFLELTGKYALVTGANIGIGYATTLALVTHGAQWPAEVKSKPLRRSDSSTRMSSKSTRTRKLRP